MDMDLEFTGEEAPATVPEEAAAPPEDVGAESSPVIPPALLAFGLSYAFGLAGQARRVQGRPWEHWILPPDQAQRIAEPLSRDLTTVFAALPRPIQRLLRATGTNPDRAAWMGELGQAVFGRIMADALTPREEARA